MNSSLPAASPCSLPGQLKISSRVSLTGSATCSHGYNRSSEDPSLWYLFVTRTCITASEPRSSAAVLPPPPLLPPREDSCRGSDGMPNRPLEPPSLLAVTHNPTEQSAAPQSRVALIDPHRRRVVSASRLPLLPPSSAVLPIASYGCPCPEGKGKGKGKTMFCPVPFLFLSLTRGLLFLCR